MAVRLNTSASSVTRLAARNDAAPLLSSRARCVIAMTLRRHGILESRPGYIEITGEVPLTLWGVRGVSKLFPLIKRRQNRAFAVTGERAGKRIEDSPQLGPGRLGCIARFGHKY